MMVALDRKSAEDRSIERADKGQRERDKRNLYLSREGA